jgi:hypothetical protein
MESFIDQIKRVRMMASPTSDGTWDFSDNDYAALQTVLAVLDKIHTFRPLDEYHEDMGYVLWWHLPVQEPPDVYGLPEEIPEGYPDGWHTHFSLLPDQRLYCAGDEKAVFCR